MTDALFPVMLIAPLIGGALALFGKLSKRSEAFFRLFSLSSLIGIGVALIATAGTVYSGTILRYSLGGWPEPYGIALVLDGFAWISVALIFIVSFLVGLFALGDAHYGADFFFFFLLLTAGMIGVALTGDLFTMFVAFEIVAIAAYVLIAYEKSPTGLVASFKYLMLSSTGILFFLFGVFLIYRDLGTLSISEISRILAQSKTFRDAPAIHLALASLCVGIGVRTAFIPFHTWLPEAHAYAPHPVSALLSGVLIKISLFAMLRLLLQFGGAYLFDLLLWIGAITALVAVFSALTQSDAKRLLAFHSISQMGYVLAVFGAGSSIALTSSVAHALNHAFFKSLLFLTVGIAVQRSGERNLYKIRPLGREIPLVAAAFFVGAFSIAGIPPFNGFASKALIGAGMKGSPAYILLTITGFGTAASFIKLSRIFLPGQRAVSRSPIPLMPWLASRLPLVLLSLLCLGGGLFGADIARLLHRILTGEVQALAFFNPFSRDKLISLIPVILLGILIYRLLLSPWGTKISRRLRRLAPDLESVVGFFLAGLLLFAGAAFF